MGFRHSVIQMESTKPAPAPEPGPLFVVDQEPGLGAHLATRRPWYTHHGIYIGSGKVVHYSGLSVPWRFGPVEEVTISDFVYGHPMWVVEHAESTYSAHEIVRRARSRIGEHAYRLLTNNCEHFCNWCVNGLSHRAQVERRLEFSSHPLCLLATITSALQRMIASSWRRVYRMMIAQPEDPTLHT
jgi:hypothetical protein